MTALIVVVALLTVAAGLIQGLGRDVPGPSDDGEGRPNVVLIVTDDQRYDGMDVMGRTQGLIFDEGTQFSNAYVTTPVCCPSRASILTGQYAHAHGVRNNSDDLERPTFVEKLKAAGYRTALVGKYLNSWDGSWHPDFHTWVSFPWGDSLYYDPEVVVGNEKGVHEGYITHLLRDHATAFIRDAANSDEPFLLIFAPNAPHRPSDPAPGDADLFDSLPPYRPPSWNETAIDDKPSWVQQRTPLTGPEAAMLDRWRLRMLRSLHALDLAIEEIVATLEHERVLENTVIIFLSDNGFLLGEHRLWGKGAPYEESVHVPFAIRYPNVFRPGAVRSEIVANIDIAPTILDLAGVDGGTDADGRSLVSLMNTTAPWRSALLLEAWPNGREWTAAHNGDQVLVQTRGDRSELYDLTVDPYQTENRIDDPRYAPLVAELKAAIDMHRAGVGQ